MTVVIMVMTVMIMGYDGPPMAARMLVVAVVMTMVMERGEGGETEKV